MTPEDDHAFLTLAQLARRSGESLAVWRKRIHFRQIAYVKCGRNVRVLEADYRAWVQARIVHAVSVAATDH
jgi:hypothetical protein